MSDTHDEAGTGADASRITRLFDIRLIVGGLLSLYGVILIVKSFFDTSAEIAKAAGTHLNLWTGVGMLVVGLFMLGWMRWRPLQPPSATDLAAGQDDGPQGSRAD